METDLIERVARAWASMGDNLDDFNRERDKGYYDYDDPDYTGHYEGYMADAEELLRRAGLTYEIERLRQQVEERVEYYMLKDDE